MFWKRTKPPIDDPELLRRYAVLLREHRDFPALARLLTADEWRRIEELSDAAVLRFIRQRYDCDSREAAHLHEQWREYLTDCLPMAWDFTADGDVCLHDHERRLFDTWAAEIGLTPR